MAQPLPLRFARSKGPLWLVLALVAAIMVGLSSPGAHARPVVLLLQNLGRDLGALRLQLEQVAAQPPQPGAAAIAFNADLGDGGPGFHRAAMATTLRTAQRSAALLDQRFRDEGDVERLRLTQQLALGLHVLERSLLTVERAPDPATLEAAWTAAEVELRDLEQILASLRSRGPVPATVPEAVASPAPPGDLAPAPAGPAILRGAAPL